MTEPSFPSGPPSEISQLVRERVEARATRNWARADELKAQIEAAGWRVVDRGKRSSVRPATPPTLEIEGERRYGSASDVPSALDAPASIAWTAIVLASEDPPGTSALLDALREHSPAAIQVVVVANDPSDAQAAALRPGSPDRSPIAGRVPEVLRTSARLGYAAALNIGLRRATGELVLLADGSALPTGDALTPLATALGDPDVAVAGGFGLLGDEDGPFRPAGLQRAEAAPGRAVDVAAIDGSWLAFRRDDIATLGPIDEHFVTPGWVDVWWSLRLRAGADDTEIGDTEIGEAPDIDKENDDRDGVEDVEAATEHDSGGPAESSDQAPEAADLPAPRRALMLELPLRRAPDASAWPPDRTRLNRRNMYRVLDAFGWRDDLA